LPYISHYFSIPTMRPFSTDRSIRYLPTCPLPTCLFAHLPICKLAHLPLANLPTCKLAYLPICLFALCLLTLCQSCTTPPPPRILIFSKTNGYRHESIEAGKEALVKICAENGMLADTTEDAVYFNERNLKRYAAVVFLNTNGEVLNARQEADFERYIQAGGGFMGVHSASGTEYTWRWYGGLVGAYFKDHPAIQTVDLNPENCGHPAVEHLGCQAWNWKEELYNFRNYAPDLTVLLSVRDSSYKGGTVPEGSSTHPLAWCHEYDGGRAFYTALGHIPAAYSDPVFQQHLLGGLRYAVGKNAPLRYARCRTPRLPDQTRFVKTVIAGDLDEPMEIALLPDDKILMIERHGQIKLYNPATGLLNTVAKLPVYSEMGDGIIGLCIDPNWSENHWIYLYYASLRDSMNQLSRFVFQGDTLDRASEKVLLTIPVGHKDCFHAAGSMAFDAQGNLFLATGDNTSPFASDGFNPIDERPGKIAFDAQRSSGNTADLRGKILRIKPLPDGSYLCPAGNLFTQKDTLINSQSETAGTNNTSRTRPEIYVMGCRNPFRISYDKRRAFLFWGEIGPDAGKSDTARGPMGHDEINRARSAGNFGWPYFVGDNQAYRDYDFAAKKPGPYFDPKHPVNDSPNNTGLQDLPPAQPAFIWYPYGKNRDFPILGSGGRNAMAGPVYYADEFPEATRFPDYYNGKLIIYDWMRNWLMAVTMDSLGNFQHLEPFADSVKLSRPMDMFFDRKGSLWLIEYGTRWYSSNEDARLSRIDFVRGNRAPLAVFKTDKVAVAAGSPITFDWSKSTDYDGGDLSFELDYGDGEVKIFTQKENPDHYEPILSHAKATAGEQQTAKIYQQPGNYVATLKVRDETGAFSTQNITLHIGNEAPSVRWDLSGRNQSFYLPGDTLRYRLVVADREDGSLTDGRITAAAVNTSIDFFEKGINPTALQNKTAQNAAPEKFAEGKRLIDGSDCKSCHAVDKLVNGPSFMAVAERYRNNKDFAVPAIYRKIIYGGVGNWGQSAMLPHPMIREEEAIQMALWILALGDPPKALQSLALQGNYVLKPEKDGKAAPLGAFVLRGSYSDKGSSGQPSLQNSATLVLRPATLQAEKCDKRREGVGNYKPDGKESELLNELKHNAWFAFQAVDLTGVKGLTLRVGYGDKKYPYAGGTLEVRLGSPHGDLLGTAQFESKNGEKMLFEERSIALAQPSNKGELEDLYFVFRNIQNQGQGVIGLDWVRFELKQ
jgi:cytochrome c